MNHRIHSVGYNAVTDNMGLSSFVCVASQICNIPQNFPKIQTHSSSGSSKVINLGASQKHVCNFLLVINSNFVRISYRFWDIKAFLLKTARFPSHICWTPPGGGTPSDINAMYTRLESTFSGLQFCRRHYGSMFIRSVIVSSQNRKKMRNSAKIWPYSSSRSSKVIDLGINQKLVCNFLLVINSIFGRICCHFQDIDG